jgi:hypothetical protein
MPPLRNTDRAWDVRHDELAKLSPAETEEMRRVLAANRDKNFVQRITNASDWPVTENPGGGYSSHRMANTEAGGKGYAYPTLFYNKDTNALYEPQDPMAEAKKTGDFIEFPDPAAAERFASNEYKVGMDTGLMQQMVRPEPSVAQKILNPDVIGRMWR